MVGSYTIQPTAALSVCEGGIKNTGGWIGPDKLPSIRWNCRAQQLFRIPYWEFEDGSIVTANDRAWMNTQYCAMWLEVMVKGYMD